MEPRTEIGANEISQIEEQTLDSILKGQRNNVSQLYQKMKGVFIAGSDYTKSLIANKFIYPISIFLERNYSWGKEYLDMFPKALRGEYIR